MAQHWVSTNHKLIRQMASPYFRFMAGDDEDLYQEAIIVAFKAFVISKKKGQPEKFVPFFRVIFKTNCIKLAPGVQTVHCLEDHIFLSSEQPEEVAGEPRRKDINEALAGVTRRQREICLWLLKQPTPVSTPDIAQEFNVSRRHACRLVSGSIQNILGA